MEGLVCLKGFGQDALPSMWTFPWESFLWHVQFPSSGYYIVFDYILFSFGVAISSTKVFERTTMPKKKKGGEDDEKWSCLLGLLSSLDEI